MGNCLVFCDGGIKISHTRRVGSPSLDPQRRSNYPGTRNCKNLRTMTFFILVAFVLLQRVNRVTNNPMHYLSKNLTLIIVSSNETWSFTKQIQIKPLLSELGWWIEIIFFFNCCNILLWLYWQVLFNNSYCILHQRETNQLYSHWVLRQMNGRWTGE